MLLVCGLGWVGGSCYCGLSEAFGGWGGLGIDMVFKNRWVLGRRFGDLRTSTRNQHMGITG